ncbi:MAG: hypothetical protein AAGD34_13625 [Pseudomonadota bacterium]
MAASITDSRRSDRLAGLVGLSVMLVVLTFNALIALVALSPELERLRHSSLEATQALAISLADDVGRAVALGIPLEEIYQADQYLQNTLIASPEASAVAVVDGNEQMLYQAGIAMSEASEVVRTPILADRQTVGAVLIVPSHDIVHEAMLHLIALGLAVALVAGCAVGAWFRIQRLERVDLPRARFVAGGRSVARGHFADYSPPASGSPFRPLGILAARLTTPVRRAHRILLALADEVRALDTAGAHAKDIAQSVAPVAPYWFERARLSGIAQAGGAWWIAIAFALGEATRGLTASFAADRIGNDPFATIAVGGAVGADALGSVLGLLFALALKGRYAKAAIAVGLALAGVGLGITIQLRDPLTFVAMQMLAGFGLWLALFSALCQRGTLTRLPWRAALLLLAAWATGPVIGGILAEAEGRRLAYATVGAALLAMALLSLLVPSRPRLSQRARPRLELPAGIALFAIAMAIVTWADIHLAVTQLRENYAHLALNFALIGTASLLPFAMGLRLPPASAVALALAALGAATVVSVPAVVVSMALGLGLGIAVSAARAGGFTGTGALALLTGALAAALIEISSYWTQITVVPVTAAVLVAALALTLATGGGRPIADRDA